MSNRSRWLTASKRLDDRTAVSDSAARSTRWLALLAAVGLIVSYASVLYHITDVVGGAQWLFSVAIAAFVLATISARFLRLRTALGLAVLALAVGLGVYLSTIPEVYFTIVTLDRITTDLFALLTGLSIVQIVKADIWAIGMTPGPVFLTWYLALRRRYDLSAWVGGLMLVFFVLTGDAGQTTTLVGSISALGVLGFGTLDRSDATWKQVQNLGLVLAAAVLAARVLNLVPNSDGTANGVSGGRSEGTSTIEGSLISADDRVSILGSISLSPEARFSVTADRAAFWHAGGYDRYTGGDWVRTGRTESYSGPRSPPPGETMSIEQEFRAESPIQTMPAAWKPTQLRGTVPVDVRVSSSGDLQPATSFSSGDTYTVVSEASEWTRAQLRDAGTTYPNEIRERYLQLPESTPDRLGRRAADLTTDAETAYDAAVELERWLEANKEYSLDVRRPDGSIADTFVFEMDRGYCVYYATAMAVMLRTLDIPARFAVGYTPGEQVTENRWVVRGFDSHAWIEVYFPEIGWVPFDPTPSGPRQAAERTRLERARGSSESNVDTDETGATTSTPTPTPSRTAEGNATATNRTTPTRDRSALRPEGSLNGSELTPSQDNLVAGGPETGASGTPPSSPNRSGSENVTSGFPSNRSSNRDRLALLAGAVGLTIGAYRFGLVKRGFEAARLRWQQPTDSPNADAVRALERLERLLQQRYRARRTDETVRAYFAALDSEEIDARAHRVAEIYEHAQYAGEVSRREADEAIELVDQLVRENSPLP